MNASELQEILRLHALWLRGENGGKRANLRHADLSYANLRGANLLLIGQDSRGYLFCAWQNDSDVVVIRAGCHEFIGIAAARKHWTERHQDDAVLHEDCLSLVDRCERMAKVRGWKLEPQPAVETA